MRVTDQIQAPSPKEHQESRSWCLLLTEGPRAELAQRLSALVAPLATVNLNRPPWLPRGLAYPVKAKLCEMPDLLSLNHREAWTNW